MRCALKVTQRRGGVWVACRLGLCWPLKTSAKLLGISGVLTVYWLPQARHWRPASPAQRKLQLQRSSVWGSRRLETVRLRYGVLQCHKNFGAHQKGLYKIRIPGFPGREGHLTPKSSCRLVGCLLDDRHVLRPQPRLVARRRGQRDPADAALQREAGLRRRRPQPHAVPSVCGRKGGPSREPNPGHRRRRRFLDVFRPTTTTAILIHLRLHLPKRPRLPDLGPPTMHGGIDGGGTA